MSVPQRFTNREYKNWLKCMGALNTLKEGLHRFINPIVKELHEIIKQKVLFFLGGSNRSIECSSCSSKDIFLKRATGQNPAKWMINCPVNICDVWLDEILYFHYKPDKKSINWMNSDISKWDTDPYEIAKVFMPKGLDKKTNLPKELDIPEVLSLLKCCTLFIKHVPNTQLLTDLIDVRNTLYYTGSLKVQDADRDNWIDMMSQLAIDLSLQDSIRNSLYMLKKEEIHTSVQKTETKALMNIVNLLKSDIEGVKNQMACLQETQSQLSMQAHKIEDDTSDTIMKTETLEKDLKDVKLILIELTHVSDKIVVFLGSNDIKDKYILGVVGSNEKNIIELRSRQCEVEKSISDIKSELTSVKEQVGKHKEETNQMLKQLEVTVEKNEREVESYKKERRIRRCELQILWSAIALLFVGVIAVASIYFCLTLKPILGDEVYWMIAAAIITIVCGIYFMAMTIWTHNIYINENRSKSLRLLIRCGSLFFGFLLCVAMTVCSYKTVQFYEDEAMNGLTEKIKRTYVGVFPAGEPFSDAFDRFQIEYRCCGVKDYTDFYNAENWNRTSTRTNDTMMIPPSCCKMKHTDQEIHQPIRATCTVDGYDSNIDNSCWDDIKGKYNRVILLVSFAVIVQVIIFGKLLYQGPGFIYDIIRRYRSYCFENNCQRI